MIGGRVVAFVCGAGGIRNGWVCGGGGAPGRAGKSS